MDEEKFQDGPPERPKPRTSHTLIGASPEALRTDIVVSNIISILTLLLLGVIVLGLIFGR
jgi:hypothetical protein